MLLAFTGSVARRAGGGADPERGVRPDRAGGAGRGRRRTCCSGRLSATATALRFSGHRHTLAAMLTGLAIGFYDGALGPGTGSFFVFTLVGLLGYSFLEASAKARLANWATNAAALCVFVPHGAVLWKIGLVMGACNLAGGYVGARTAVSRGTRVRPGLLHPGRLGVHHPDRRRPRGTVVNTSYLTTRARRRGRDRGQAVPLPVHPRPGRGRDRCPRGRRAAAQAALGRAAPLLGVRARPGRARSSGPATTASPPAPPVRRCWRCCAAATSATWSPWSPGGSAARCSAPAAWCGRTATRCVPVSTPRARCAATWSAS